MEIPIRLIVKHVDITISPRQLSIHHVEDILQFCDHPIHSRYFRKYYQVGGVGSINGND